MKRPASKTSAESAELRKVSNGAGCKAAGNAEIVRKKCGTSLSSSSLATATQRPATSTAREMPLSLVPVAPMARRARAKTLPRAAPMQAARDAWPAHEQAVIDAALSIIQARLGRPGAVLNEVHAVRDFLRLHLATHEWESFAVIFLNAQHAVIAFEEMFRGTIAQTSVYPREVVREALRHNAAAVILAHNHPSGCPEPSKADEYLTHALKVALNVVDVRVLDHMVVGGADIVSMAQRGLM